MSSDRTLRWLWLLALCACGGAAQHPKAVVDLSPASLYPMAVGHAWAYDVDAGDGDSVLAVTRVTALRDGVVELANGGEQVLRYGLVPDGIAHVGKPGHLLKAPIEQGASWSSGPTSMAMVMRIGEQVTGPAGTFGDCVVVAERHRDNEQRIETTYCPGVGPVSLVSEMEVRGQVMRVSAVLRGYDVSR